MFFVTGLYELQKNKVTKIPEMDYHCLGYFKTYDEAENAIKTDMYLRESVYDYLVLEEIEPGICVFSKKDVWFGRNVNQDWVEIEPPRYVRRLNIKNFAIG